VTNKIPSPEWSQFAWDSISTTAPVNLALANEETTEASSGTKHEMNLDKRSASRVACADRDASHRDCYCSLSLTGCDGIVGPSTSRDHGQQHDASQQPQSVSRGSRDTLDTLLTDHRGTGWTRGCATGIPTEGCSESVFLPATSSPLLSRHAQTPPRRARRLPRLLSHPRAVLPHRNSVLIPLTYLLSIGDD